MSAERAAHFLQHLAERRSSLREELEDDISGARGMSLEERGKLLESVCRDAMAILHGRPDCPRYARRRINLFVSKDAAGPALDALIAAGLENDPPLALDLVDLERLRGITQGSLDLACARAALLEVVGEDDYRTKKWDELVAQSVSVA